MQINFVKTHPDAVIPTRGSAGAAGFDLTAVSLKRAADLYIYDIGIAMEIPAGYFAAIFPRSSIFFTGLELTNCVGVIDSDFRAPISAIFREVLGDQHARRLALHPLFPRKNAHDVPLQAGRQNRPAHHPAVRCACHGPRHPVRNGQHSALLRS